MELKLVYRILRKISDWTVEGYYSETYIEGQENVPGDGPLIIASTHHNEIIDIATLAATMPHRRHVSFWAKSTMFANPIAGGILSSSGAIPVRRNPNSSSPSRGAPRAEDPSSSIAAGRATPGMNESTSRAILFQDTSRALAANQVIGVFPEGTSYTQASIVQVLPGTAWAAIEYARYVRERGVAGRAAGDATEEGNSKGRAVEDMKGTGLRIIPVAIVYTDKSRYLSRLFVKYGEPILIDSYATGLFDGNRDENSKAIVKKVMSQVDAQLREMTINALDWDTTCAVSMARSILWDDEDKIPMKDWVAISQRLVRIFDKSPESSHNLKASLTKYYALLHYARIKHSVLLSLLPLSSTNDVPPPLSVAGAGLLVRPTVSMIIDLPLALVQLALFAPAMLFHFPGYITGPLAQRYFAQPGEQEARAQFKAVGGGLGIGANMGLVLGLVWKRNNFGMLTSLLGLTENDNAIKKTLALAGSVYFGVVLLVRWHRLLVKATINVYLPRQPITESERSKLIQRYKAHLVVRCELARLQRLLTYSKLVAALALPWAQNKLSTAEVDAFSRPPLPAANVFIKKREASPPSPSGPAVQMRHGSASLTRHLAPWKLVPYLLAARTLACTELKVYLQAGKDEELVRYLASKGAKI